MTDTRRMGVCVYVSVCVLCIIALRILEIEGLLCHKIPIVCFLINASFILNYIFCFNGFQGLPGLNGEMGLRVRINNKHRKTHTFTQSLFLLFTLIVYILSYYWFRSPQPHKNCLSFRHYLVCLLLSCFLSLQSRWFQVLFIYLFYRESLVHRENLEREVLRYCLSSEPLLSFIVSLKFFHTFFI